MGAATWASLYGEDLKSVFVIDAKNIKGKVRVAKPLFGATKLRVLRTRPHEAHRRPRPPGVRRSPQVLEASGHADVPVQGALCFTTADLPLLGTPKMRGHFLLYRKALAQNLERQRAAAAGRD